MSDKTLSSYDVTIRESHIDMLGHMNNAVYLTLYEEARWEAITAAGYGLDTIMATKQSPVVLEVTVKFLREIRLREKITITTAVVSYDGKVGKMEQKMILPDGTVASAALFTFGLFDLNTRRLIEPTAAWRNVIGK